MPTDNQQQTTPLKPSNGQRLSLVPSTNGTKISSSKKEVEKKETKRRNSTTTSLRGTTSTLLAVNNTPTPLKGGGKKDEKDIEKSHQQQNQEIKDITLEEKNVPGSKADESENNKNNNNEKNTMPIKTNKTLIEENAILNNLKNSSVEEEASASFNTPVSKKLSPNNNTPVITKEYEEQVRRKAQELQDQETVLQQEKLRYELLLVQEKESNTETLGLFIGELKKLEEENKILGNQKSNISHLASKILKEANDLKKQHENSQNLISSLQQENDENRLRIDELKRYITTAGIEIVEHDINGADTPNINGRAKERARYTTSPRVSSMSPQIQKSDDTVNVATPVKPLNFDDLVTADPYTPITQGINHLKHQQEQSVTPLGMPSGFRVNNGQLGIGEMVDEPEGTVFASNGTPVRGGTTVPGPNATAHAKNSYIASLKKQKASENLEKDEHVSGLNAQIESEVEPLNTEEALKLNTQIIHLETQLRQRSEELQQVMNQKLLLEKEMGEYKNQNNDKHLTEKLENAEITKKRTVADAIQFEEDTKRKIIELEEDNKKLKTTIDAQNKQHEQSIQSEKENHEKFVRKDQEKYKNIVSQLDAAIQTIEDNKKELSESKKISSERSDELEKHKETILVLEKELKVSNKASLEEDRIKDELKEMQKTKAKQFENYQKTSQKVLRQQKEEISRLESEREKQEETIRQLTAKADELELENQSNSPKPIDNLAAELSGEDLQSLDQSPSTENIRLREELEESKTVLENVITEKESLSQELDAQKEKEGKLKANLELINEKLNESEKSNGALSSELENLETKKEKLENSLKEANEKVIDLEAKASELTKEIGKHSEATEEAEKNLKIEKGKNEEQLEELNKLKTQLETSVKEVETLNQKKDDLENSLSILQKKRQKERVVFDNMVWQEATMINCYKDLLGLSDSEKDIYLPVLHEKITQDFTRNKSQLEEITKARDESDSQKKELREQLKETNQAKSNLETQLQELTERSEFLQNEKEVNEDVKTELENQIDEKNNEITQKILEIQELKILSSKTDAEKAEEISILKTNITQLEQEKLDTQKQIEEKDAEIVEFKNKVNEYQTRIDNLNIQLKQLQNQIQESEKDIAEKDTEIEKIKFSEKQLNEENNDAKAKIVELKEKIKTDEERLKESKKTAKKSREEIEKNNKALKQQVEEDSKKLNESNAKEKELNEKLSLIVQEKANLETKINGYDIRIKTLTDSKSERKKKNNKLTQTNEVLEQERSKLESKFQVLEEGTKKLEAEKATLAEVKTSLKSELTTVKAEQDAQEKQHAEAIAELQTKIDLKQSELDSAEKNLKELQAELNKKEKIISDSIQSFKNLESEVKSFSDQTVIDIKKITSERDEKNQAQKEKIEKQFSDIQQLENDLSTLKKQHDELKTEKAALMQPKDTRGIGTMTDVEGVGSTEAGDIEPIDKDQPVDPVVPLLTGDANIDENLDDNIHSPIKKISMSFSPLKTAKFIAVPVAGIAILQVSQKPVLEIAKHFKFNMKEMLKSLNDTVKQKTNNILRLPTFLEFSIAAGVLSGLIIAITSNYRSNSKLIASHKDTQLTAEFKDKNIIKKLMCDAKVQNVQLER